MLELREVDGELNVLRTAKLMHQLLGLEWVQHFAIGQLAYKLFEFLDVLDRF